MSHSLRAVFFLWQISFSCDNLSVFFLEFLMCTIHLVCTSFVLHVVDYQSMTNNIFLFLCNQVTTIVIQLQPTSVYQSSNSCSIYIFNLKCPPLVISTIIYGPNQSILNLPGCLKQFLSYIRTSPLTQNCLFLMCRSCHIFCLSFSMFWWDPVTKRSSSSCTSCNNHSSTTLPYFIYVITTILRLCTMYSIEITASFPYIKRNGVQNMNFLQVMW